MICGSLFVSVGSEDYFFDNKESAGKRRHFVGNFGDDGGVYGE